MWYGRIFHKRLIYFHWARGRVKIKPRSEISFHITLTTRVMSLCSTAWNHRWTVMLASTCFSCPPKEIIVKISRVEYMIYYIYIYIIYNIKHITIILSTPVILSLLLSLIPFTHSSEWWTWAQSGEQACLVGYINYYTTGVTWFCLTCFGECSVREWASQVLQVVSFKTTNI